jgi:hypothetical protein
MMRRLSVLVLSSLALLPACQNDTGVGSGDLVTIAGVVRNVDDLSAAEGVRVQLLGRNVHQLEKVRLGGAL